MKCTRHPGFSLWYRDILEEKYVASGKMNFRICTNNEDGYCQIFQICSASSAHSPFCSSLSQPALALPYSALDTPDSKDKQALQARHTKDLALKVIHISHMIWQTSRSSSAQHIRIRLLSACSLLSLVLSSTLICTELVFCEYEHMTGIAC